ncbi:MAG: nuclear transport factor 2 family protein [Steroidobacteraceae bacterium]
MMTLRPLPGLIRVFLRATLLAGAVLAGYDVCRAAPTEVPAEAAADVIATDREFAQTALESGIRAAYDRFLADDAVVFRPLPVRAREWLDTHEPATGRLEWAPVLAETACDSSLAVTLGTWSYTAQDSKVADSGQYLTVWRPAVAGEWRIALDQSIDQPSLPAAALPAGAACDGTPPTLEKLLKADRRLNSGLRQLHGTNSPSIDVRANTAGSVTGSARADLAVTHGELRDERAARGSKPQVRAVYVRVWQRDGRSWRVLHDFVTPVTP